MLSKEFYTANLNKVLSFAEKTLKTMGGVTLDTTYFIFGLLNVECEANNTLKKLGILAQNFVLTVDKNHSAVINLSSEAKYALEYAQKLAACGGSEQVNTEHLLLSILLGKTEAAAYFNKIGFNVDRAISIIAKKTGTAEMLSQNGYDIKLQEDEDLGPLEAFGYSLTKRARSGKLDPVIGRETEIERVIQILCRRTKNNPVLTGEAGVGKSAVVEGLSSLIATDKVPDIIKNKIIFSLDLAGLLAGTKFRGEFEQKLRDAVNFMINKKNIILFIDEIHNLVGAGSTGDSKMDAAEILKPVLARGDLQTIGATTMDEYRRYISKDPALERRFQVVNVEQPSVEQTVEILKGLKEKYEAHHNVTISDDALSAAANLSARYITDRFLPDKAVDLIDEAASMIRLTSFTSSPQLSEVEEKIRLLTAQKNRAKTHDDFIEAEKFKNLIAEETLHLQKLKLSLGLASRPVVNEDTIAQTVSKWTGIPIAKLSESESAKLLNLEDTLSKSIIGQQEAVHAVSTALRRARAGLKDPKRPIGSFIFVGSTGVGKSELSKALAKIMFGEENDIINVDMSEYGEANSVNKLIGAPPGFIGYEESGQLTEKVRRRPYSIVLFDEIEKAHPDVFNVFLQILDEGRLTDNRGRVVDFKNTVIIMTSNVGAEININVSDINTNDSNYNYDILKEKYFAALKRTFKPEFLNRVDDIVVFHPLSYDAAKQIAALFMQKLANRLKENNLHIEFTDSAVNILAHQGYSAEYGARPLKRIIQRWVEDKLSEALLGGKIKKGDKIIIDGYNNKILFKK